MTTKTFKRFHKDYDTTGKSLKEWARHLGSYGGPRGVREHAAIWLMRKSMPTGV